jgi:hypothetical protein
MWIIFFIAGLFANLWCVKVDILHHWYGTAVFNGGVALLCLAGLIAELVDISR